MIPKYLKLKEQLIEDIQNKKYPLYSKLPTELELAELYKVSRSTVRQALELMTDDGIIEKKWGSGNTVISNPSSTKAKQVAILLPSLKEEKYFTLFEDTKTFLSKEGLEAFCLESNYSINVERQLLEDLLKESYGGFILAPISSGIPNINIDLYQKLMRRQRDLIFVYNRPYSIPSGCLISGDDYNTGYQAARRLINAGKNDFGGVFFYDEASSMNRYHGFIDAIRDASLPLKDDSFSFETVKNFGTDSVESTLEPTASIGKLAAKALLSIKKDGSAQSSTISYKLR